MNSKKWACLLAGATAMSLSCFAANGVADSATVGRTKAQKLMQAGNYKEAYDAYSALVLDPAAEVRKVGGDLQQALQCLVNLGRIREVDEFREKAIDIHARNWRLLHAAAGSFEYGEHQGSLVAGGFERGPHRGGTARLVNSFERDRVHALQLMQQAVDAAATDPARAEVGQLYLNFAGMWLDNRFGGGAWRLGTLTELKTLPDYEEGWYAGDAGRRGAPVDADGQPVFHRVPKSWDAATTDGERWRWCLMQAVECDSSLQRRALFSLAEFCRSQFGVETLAQESWFHGRGGDDDDTRKNESGVFALHTLSEDETIARLATGIKRFKLPDEFNFIRICRQLAEKADWPAESALECLAREFENRRQYPKAVAVWQEIIQRFGAGPDNWRQKQLAQITGNWGEFEPVMTQPSGAEGAAVEFRFRNGTRVGFEAYEIDVPKLLADLKAYLKSNPKQIEWEKIDVSNIGYRLVERNQGQYLGVKAASWTLGLTPRPNHWDRRVTVRTPLKKAGAYLVTARMTDGNTTRIVLWVADTAIVKKPLDQGAFYFVADAVNGRPLAAANLEFFGYRQEWVPDKLTRGGRNQVYTREFTGVTDSGGQFIQRPDNKQGDNCQWLITASTPEGRLAFLGFTHVWWAKYHDAEYSATKVYLITDRPVYRPEQAVKFKFWVTNAKYDQEGNSAYAGHSFSVQVDNPRGEKVFTQEFTADGFGGFNGELTLGKDAPLGVYQIHLSDGGPGGGGSFRLEEYKKPEFEVKVDAPAEPVMLGEKITATIQARYYFGAPVTDAKVKYKVLRSSYHAAWYPVAYWDWFYGCGYWWFACDYLWYPGWSEWGCRRPLFSWWPGWQPQPPPELVAEAEVPVAKDGTVKVEIDTMLAKELQGDTDHRYEISAEVTDASRRTIVGQGAVLVARKPFKVHAWVDRGYYRTGDVIHASFKAQTLDHKPVQGRGDLVLFKIGYGKDDQPQENRVERWRLDTDAQGEAALQIKAAGPGQYRLSYAVRDRQGHTIEGGYLFCVMGDVAGKERFRFNEIELVPDRKEYAPGQRVQLRINTERPDSTVLLFVRPANGVCLPPKLLRLSGKSTQEAIDVVKRDMPNFFIEAVTISNGRVFSEMREIVVPPEKRVLDVTVKPSKDNYRPGEKATVKFKLTDPSGEPFVGSAVVSMFDRSVEYISGGPNVPEIREFFWKWRRSHNIHRESSLDRGSGPVHKSRETWMQRIGAFGGTVADDEGIVRKSGFGGGREMRLKSLRRTMATDAVADRSSVSVGGAVLAEAMPASAPMAAAWAALPAPAMEARAAAFGMAADGAVGGEGGGAGGPLVQPTIRSQFADTALWVAALQTDVKGEAKVELTMPENLTTWKTRVWAMGVGARCGEGSAEVVTSKNLILRLQAPRFFVQKDEVVLSANVHNYLKQAKKVQAVLEIDELGGAQVEAAEGAGAGAHKPGTALALPQGVTVPAGGETRVDWRVQVVQPGEIRMRMKALTDEESDAMEMKFPVYVHGMLKTESWSGVVRPDKEASRLTLTVPKERRPEQTRLEIRYSPTLAGAMVDALPYLVDYPYGCTEQTLNRFIPTVITQKILQRMGLNLKEIRDKRSNLNAQEIGDDRTRAADWKRGNRPNPGVPVRNPVFDEGTVQDMVQAGIERLASMQCADGGWGWFSGYGEQSWPHTTAVVVHGLQIAQANDVTVPPEMLTRGVQWLKGCQAKELAARKLYETSGGKKGKAHADDLDALVYLVLVDAKADNAAMRDFLYRDRNELAVYSKAILGIACHRVIDFEKRDMLIRNLEQYLVQDEENQTAYLKLPESNCWWYWYGSEYDAHAYYLKLLAETAPKSETASRLVKYLINNRRHATYWNSTRDTAVVIEAFADYIKASGEDLPDLTVRILVDGQAKKEVAINRENLFSYDNRLVLDGGALADGKHTIDVQKSGKGPLYFNAYLTNFTLEDPIARAGLEIKVNRRFYKLREVQKTVKAEGVRGQAVDQRVEKYERQPLESFAAVKSGDKVEVELEIDSKNDYEYIVFEDMKAAGTEPVDVRSGYNGNEMGAYVEFRDERVVFFIRALARGKHSVSYRLRAETPGRFSALPVRGSAMYAPELKANSDEFKIEIED